MEGDLVYGLTTNAL